MIIDATGREIVIGQKYGYSKQNNGWTSVVIGTAIKAEKGKVSLNEIEEKEFLWISSGNIEPNSVNHPTRARSVTSLLVFPVTIFEDVQ